MRRIQRESRRREEEAVSKQEKPVKALWKSSKYDDISSKVKENLNVGDHYFTRLIKPVIHNHSLSLLLLQIKIMFNSALKMHIVFILLIFHDLFIRF